MDRRHGAQVQGYKAMTISLKNDAIETFSQELERVAGHHIAECYQCGKCSAGCPVTSFMDLMPHEVVRYCQLGMRDEALGCRTIWVCASCETCSTRCPKEFDIAGLMDTLREISVREGKVAVTARDVVRFHKAFLDMTKQFGRLYELGLVGDYKTRSLHLLQDASLGPKMFFKGKLGLLPHRVKNARAVKRIFENVEKLTGKSP